MLQGLGAREITYVDSSGKEGRIRIDMESRGTRRTDLGDGEYLDEFVGVINIVSEPINHQIELSGTDEIQLAFRLLWMADVYVQTRFRERGMDVYKVFPGDVDRAFGIYN